MNWLSLLNTTSPLNPIKNFTGSSMSWHFLPLGSGHRCPGIWQLKNRHNFRHNFKSICSDLKKPWYWRVEFSEEKRSELVDFVNNEIKKYSDCRIRFCKEFASVWNKLGMLLSKYSFVCQFDYKKIWHRMERGIKMPIKITNDDIILLSSIAEYKFLTVKQLAALCQRSQQVIRRRLRLFKSE